MKTTRLKYRFYLQKSVGDLFNQKINAAKERDVL